MGSAFFQQPPSALVYKVVLRSRTLSIIQSPIKLFGGTALEPFGFKVPLMSTKSHDAQVDADAEEHLLADLNVSWQDESHFMSKPKPSRKRITKREVEMERRRKIGLANKGNIPWNKGRQHSHETRERIKRRTIEALRDPKVRKKMSDSPHSHSEQSKAKIGFSLRKIWEERLKHKELQAKCYSTWAGVIAEAARKGSYDQEELEWDSFDKMNSDILSQHIQWKSDKVRQKEIARRRAERAAKVKANKMLRQAQEKKENCKIKAESSKGGPLGQEEKKKPLAISGDRKLRDRLAKIRRKQQFGGHLYKDKGKIEVQESSEKWDLDFIKREKMRQVVSLADQLLAVKKERRVHTGHDF